jgi:hypothetical protein
VTVREAIAALPLPDYLEAEDLVDAELSYLLAVLRTCAENRGLAAQLPAMLRTVANEIQRVRNGEAQPADPRQASALVRQLWTGEPGPN